MPLIPLFKWQRWADLCECKSQDLVSERDGNSHGSVVFFQRTWVSFPQTPGCPQPFVTNFKGDLKPFSGLQRHWTRAET